MRVIGRDPLRARVNLNGVFGASVPSRGLAGRGGRIRTGDLLLPKQALCQAQLHPARSAGIQYDCSRHPAI